ncbi:maltooligosyltrehalose trehalohydrolase [Nitrobacteraceae bacterium AZCC 1564]
MNANRFGASLTEDGVIFSLWAPAAKSVDVVIDGIHAMQRDDAGWFSTHVSGARSGTRYKFRIDGKLDVPDPASHFQPGDVGGPSEVIDHTAYRWRAESWRGRPWKDTVLIETHVGTFTPQGTYRAMIEKLDHLATTGFTALELMPLADFPGRRNWGYDGVLWYAPDSNYGRPDDLKALIDEAHLRGLMVFLDVVYNHFGPEGNYLGRYAPTFFSNSQTPWGNAIDYRVPEVRQFAVGNALRWLKNYRFDGLRLDAVHAIAEMGDALLLNDLSRAAGEFAQASGRQIHLVLENDDNRATLLDPITNPPSGKYRAQWNDDYHHAWHVLLTEEAAGYYRDYPTPRASIARALRSGFAYQGEASAHRDGALRGEASGDLSPLAFVNFLQNHDQIGNRPLGDRLETTANISAIEAALAMTLLSPMPPMMFMGEEWGTTSPFPFFCDFSGDLAEAVRQGRRAEFKSAYAEYGDEIPDPLNETTFRSAQLNWSEIDKPVHRARLALIRKLLAIRHAEIIPRLDGSRFDDANVNNDGLLLAQWTLGGGATLQLIANLSDSVVAIPASYRTRSPIWGEIPRSELAPWAVVWDVGDR